jgi:nucleotide-binding universal stress UspA family protein
MGGPFRRVLVGWDGSPDAAEALSVALQIAIRDRGHVVALAVLRQEAHPEASDDGEDGPPAIARLAEAQFEQLRRRMPASQVRLTAHVIVDGRSNAGQAVCDYAEAHGFDLVVLGRRGEAGGRSSRLGRVADEAAQRSRVPLLLLGAP